VLAVFAGFVLWGLRAQLPLEGVGTEYAGVFALALSVGGGALISQRGAGPRVIGWLLAFFAPGALLLMLWSGSGQAQFGNALASLAQPVKVSMMLLGATAFTLCVLGEVTRALRTRQLRELALPDDDAVELSTGEPIMLRSPVGESASPVARPVAGHSSSLPPFSPRLAAFSVRSPRDSLRASLETTDRPRLAHTPDASESAWQVGEPTKSLPEVPAVSEAYLLQSQQFQQSGARGAGSTAELETGYTPKVSVWDFDDEPLTLPKKNYLLRGLLLLALLAGGGAAAYYGMVLPNQQKEQAAAALMNQRKVEIQAAEEREALAKQEAEAKAQAQRLEQYLNAPAPAAASDQAVPSNEPSLNGAAAIAPSE
jgi:hypothetical protein